MALPKRKRRFVIAAVIGGTALALLFIEAGFRAFGTPPLNPLISLDPHPIFHHWPPSSFEFEATSPTGDFGGFIVQFNRDGMASGRELSPEQRQGIVLLGDSFVQGVEVPEEHRLSAEIERTLKAPTLNFGCSSFSPLLSRLLFEAFQERTNPRVVVEVIYSNDISNDETYKAAATEQGGRIVAVPGPSGFRSSLVTLARKLHMTRFLVFRWKMHLLREEFEARLGEAPPDGEWFPYFNKPLTETESSDHLRFTEQNIEALAASVHSSGANFYLTTVPDRGAALRGETDFLNDHVRAHAQRAGIKYIDLVPIFRTVGVQSLYYKTNIHWNREGHALAGRAIAQRIRADHAFEGWK